MQEQYSKPCLHTLNANSKLAKHFGLQFVVALTHIFHPFTMFGTVGLCAILVIGVVLHLGLSICVIICIQQPAIAFTVQCHAHSSQNVGKLNFLVETLS